MILSGLTLDNSAISAGSLLGTTRHYLTFGFRRIRGKADDNDRQEFHQTNLERKKKKIEIEMKEQEEAA